MSVAASIYLPQFTIGETAFDGFKNEMGKFGNRVAVIHGERAWKASSQYILPALEKAELSVTGTVLYGHEATHRNAERITEDPCVREADMLLAVGGGKCLDTVKLSADHLGKPVFTIPTIASNCAPITKISIMYHEDGSFCDIPRLAQVPVHCFIDPRVILEAPVCYFRAGIGDAMAKFVESQWSAKAGERLDYGSELGITSGSMCFYPMLRDGEKALHDLEKKQVTEELENVILNIVISPGIVSVSVHPHYNGGIAHALFYGLTSRKHIEENHLHGEVVSYGTLVSLMLDKDFEKLSNVYEFHQAIGLPVCLADLELEKEDPMNDILSVTMANQELTHTPYPVNADDIRNAMQKLEVFPAAH